MTEDRLYLIDTFALIFGGIGAVGGASAIYPFIRGGFARRREDQRFQDRLRGWSDGQGAWHPGIVDRFDAHEAAPSPPAHRRS